MDYRSLKPGDLIRICVESGTPDAWNEFVHRFQLIVACTAWRIARRYEGNPSPSTIDDLVQDTFCTMISEPQRLRNFRDQWENGAFGFIRTITANNVIDCYREKNAGKRGGGVLVLNIADIHFLPDSKHDGGAARIERSAQLEEVFSCLARCVEGETAERDLMIIELYYRHGYTAEEIAHLPRIGLNVKGVESAILRVTRLAREELRGSNEKK
jgi:RNA polymerase sigma factor (sigma-70 family)